jgi:hypothetical protein
MASASGPIRFYFFVQKKKKCNSFSYIQNIRLFLLQIHEQCEQYLILSWSYHKIYNTTGDLLDLFFIYLL